MQQTEKEEMGSIAVAGEKRSFWPSGDVYVYVLPPSLLPSFLRYLKSNKKYSSRALTN
jgi:hypothetical protein